MSKKKEIKEIRKKIKRLQTKLISQIQKFDHPKYYGNKAIDGCRQMEILTNALTLEIVKLTIQMDSLIRTDKNYKN